MRKPVPTRRTRGNPAAGSPESRGAAGSPESRGARKPVARGVRGARGERGERKPITGAGAKRPSPDRKDIRAGLKEKLFKRQKEAETRTEYGGSTFLDAGETKVTYWKPGNGEHVIDIIPYAAGPNDPNTPEGEPAYCLDIKVHRGLGVNKNQEAICLAQYNQACPICEHRLELQNEQEDKEVWKKLYPTNRVIYNVVVQDNEKERQKGVQLWNVAHYYIEKTLVEIMKGPQRQGRDEAESYIPFAHPEEGKSLVFKIEPPKSKKDYASYVGHRFDDRDYSTDEYLDFCHVTDEYIKFPTYEEVYELYYGQAMESDGVEGEEPDYDEGGTTEEAATTSEEDIVDYCPAGGKWGEENNKLPDCEECEQGIWDSCYAEFERLQAEAEAKTKRRPRRK